MFSFKELARAACSADSDGRKASSGSDRSAATPNAAHDERTGEGIDTHMSQIGSTVFFVWAYSRYKTEIREFVNPVGD